MTRRYIDEPEYLNPYRAEPDGPTGATSATIAVVGALVFGLCVAAYAIY
jgi:hypothetical protein